MPSALPAVALVGRPNVGKSRLFNRLARRRTAIVHDQPGVTRDVNTTGVDNAFTLLDTGGLGLVAEPSHAELVAAAEAQVWLAVEAAQLICFVVDGREGLTALDEALAGQLRAVDVPVWLVVNKIDSPEKTDTLDEFAQLGLGEAIPVSAEHGYGAEDLRERLLAFVGPPQESADREAAEVAHRVRLAFIGRPNVGKSSLCNRLLNTERLVVSEVAGTTRDAVALDLDYAAPDGQRLAFQLVDTAGLRKRRRVDSVLEYFSTLRTRESLGAADVCLLVVDAIEGVGKQEQSLAGEVAEAGRCLIVLVNKWDLARERFEEDPPTNYPDEGAFRVAYAQAVRKELFFFPQCPVLFASAKTGEHLHETLQSAHSLHERSATRLPTPRLNALLHRLLEARSPRSLRGKRFKFYYAVQTGQRPIRIRLFCNRAPMLEDPYQRYLERALIEHFDLGGCPIQWELRGKSVRYAERRG